MNKSDKSIKNNKNFMQSFKSKKLRYGSFSALMVVIVLVALVMINLVASEFNYKFDLTPTSFYSISSNTKDVLDKLDQEITIYTLYPTGEVQIFQEMLEQYTQYSSKIKMINKDPYLNPTFVRGYTTNDEEIASYSIIVEGKDTFRVIPGDQMYTTEFSYTTFTNEISAINLEPKVTNAIEAVMANKIMNVYKISNHSESALPASFITALTDSSFNVQDFNLATSGAVPEDCNILLITTPQIDYSPDEISVLKTWLADNGRAIFLLDVLAYEHTNLRLLLNDYGFDISNFYVFEGDTSYHYPNTREFFLPVLAEHKINESAVERNIYPSIYLATGLQEVRERRESITIRPFMYTTELSYGKVDPQQGNIEKEAGDPEGPFLIGIEVYDVMVRVSESYDTKIIAFASSNLLNEQLNSDYSGGANYNYVIKSFNFLADKPETTYISSKSTQTRTQLTMTESQQLTIKLVSLVVLPVIIFGTGLVVWLRRRAK